MQPADELQLVNIATTFPAEALPIITAAGVGPDTFQDKRLALWFAAAVELFKDGRPVDLICIADALRAAGNLERAGGMAYSTAISDAVASLHHVGYHAARVANRGQLRNIAALAAGLVEDAKNPGDKTPQDIAGEFMARICATLRFEGGAGEYGGIVRGELDKWLRIAAGEPQPQGIMSGIHALDDSLQGFQPGKLYILAGRPSDGKTTFEAQIARTAAFAGTPVLRITRDSTPQSLAKRDLVAVAGNSLTIHRANKGDLLPEHVAGLKAAAESIAAAPIQVDDRTRTVENMSMAIRFAVARAKVKIVTVDYAQIVEVSSLTGRAADDERRQIAHVSRTFKALAKELSIPVVLLAQLSRKAEEDLTREPSMKDLLGSGALEQDADAIMLLFRSITYRYEEPYYNPVTGPDGKWRMEQKTDGSYVPLLNESRPQFLQRHGPRRPVVCAVVKNKEGPQARVPLFLDAGYFLFTEAPPNHGQAENAKGSKR